MLGKNARDLVIKRFTLEKELEANLVIYRASDCKIERYGNLLDSTTTVKTELSKQNILLLDEITTIVYLAQKLQTASCRRAAWRQTELAKAIAGATGRELIVCNVMKGYESRCTSGNI